MEKYHCNCGKNYNSYKQYSMHVKQVIRKVSSILDQKDISYNDKGWGMIYAMNEHDANILENGKVIGRFVIKHSNIKNISKYIS